MVDESPPAPLGGAPPAAPSQARPSVGSVLQRALGPGLRLLAPMAPRLFALLTFLAGMALLVSGALPGDPGRLAMLGKLVPQPLIELSHFTGSLVGMALLLLARSLDWRIGAAWSMTVALLAVGVLASLLSGLDYGPAIVLGITLGALLASHKEFYRRASLLDEGLSLGWLIAIGATLLGTAWLIVFAYRHVEYANELWWQFELQADAPRSLRAALDAAILLGAFGILRLLQPSLAHPRLPTSQELDAAQALVAQGRSNDDWLALTGDKSLLFSDARDAFIMYGVIGRTWVAMGPPVGPETAWFELIWRFHEHANRHGARTVFYEVPAHTLPYFLDLGLSTVKLGESARVDLADFGLGGRGARTFVTATLAPPKRARPSSCCRPSRPSPAWLGSRRSPTTGLPPTGPGRSGSRSASSTGPTWRASRSRSRAMAARSWRLSPSGRPATAAPARPT